jgi:hypothetical protein
MRAFAAFGFVFNLWLGYIVLIVQKDIEELPIVLIFLAMCVLLWFMAGSYIHMDREAVFISTGYGKFRIHWEEMKYIETDGNIFAFYGDDKRLVITLRFTGSRKQDFIKLMDEQIAPRNIKIIPVMAVPWTHKNTRVRS